MFFPKVTKLLLETPTSAQSTKFFAKEKQIIARKTQFFLTTPTHAKKNQNSVKTTQLFPKNNLKKKFLNIQEKHNS